MTPIEIIEHSESSIEIARNNLTIEKTRHRNILVSMLLRLDCYLETNPALYLAFGAQAKPFFKNYKRCDLNAERWFRKGMPEVNVLFSAIWKDPYGDRHTDDDYRIEIDERMLDSELPDTEYAALFEPWREMIRIHQNAALERKLAQLEVIQQEIQNLSVK
jgi:hypothetical protein